MARKTRGQATKDKLDADLDAALQDTFPASDPPALTEPSAGNRPARQTKLHGPGGELAQRHDQKKGP
jgi:hypothetical protein